MLNKNSVINIVNYGAVDLTGTNPEDYIDSSAFVQNAINDPCRSARWSARRRTRRSATSPTTARSKPSTSFRGSRLEFAASSAASQGPRPSLPRRDAETIVVSMGSVLGTIKDVVDERRSRGERIGVLGILVSAPSRWTAGAEPSRAARASSTSRRPSRSGSGASSPRTAAAPCAAPGIENYEVFAGLGGRPITKASLHSLLDDLAAGALEEQTFLDLDRSLVDAELAREEASRRSRPDGGEHHEGFARPHRRGARVRPGTERSSRMSVQLKGDPRHAGDLDPIKLHRDCF